MVSSPLMAKDEDKKREDSDSLPPPDDDAAATAGDAVENGDKKPFIQHLNIRSAATTVKADDSSRVIKALKIIAAFAVLWGLYAALYAAVLQATIDTGETILFVYLGIFVLFAVGLAGSVLYGMSVRRIEDEKQARSLSVAATITERRERTMAASRAGSFVPRADSALGGGGGSIALRMDSLNAAPRADSKVRFK